MTRAQAASVMVAAYAYITAGSVPPGEGSFGDIAGNRHAEAVVPPGYDYANRKRGGRTTTTAAAHRAKTGR